MANVVRVALQKGKSCSIGSPVTLVGQVIGYVRSIDMSVGTMDVQMTDQGAINLISDPTLNTFSIGCKIDSKKEKVSKRYIDPIMKRLSELGVSNES